jgi:hypothetical protein
VLQPSSFHSPAARVGRLDLCHAFFLSAREAGSAPEFPQVIEWMTV